MARTLFLTYFAVILAFSLSSIVPVVDAKSKKPKTVQKVTEAKRKIGVPEGVISGDVASTEVGELLIMTCSLCQVTRMVVEDEWEPDLLTASVVLKEAAMDKCKEKGERMIGGSAFKTEEDLLDRCKLFVDAFVPGMRYDLKGGKQLDSFCLSSTACTVDMHDELRKQLVAARAKYDRTIESLEEQEIEEIERMFAKMKGREYDESKKEDRKQRKKILDEYNQNKDLLGKLKELKKAGVLGVSPELDKVYMASKMMAKELEKKLDSPLRDGPHEEL